MNTKQILQMADDWEKTNRELKAWQAKAVSLESGRKINRNARERLARQSAKLREELAAKVAELNEAKKKINQMRATNNRLWERVKKMELAKAGE